MEGLSVAKGVQQNLDIVLIPNINFIEVASPPM